METGSQLNFIWQQSGTTVNKSNRNPGDIVFLKESGQLYVNDVYFGLSKDQGQAISSLQTEVQGLTDKVGTESKLSQTLLVVAEQLKEKLDGGSYTQGTQGPQGLAIAGIQGATPTNVVDAINKLNSFIQAVQAKACVISINNETGNVTLDGSNLKISNEGPQGLQSSSIDAAFAGVQTTLASHQTTLASHQTALNTLNGDAATAGSVAKAVNDATVAIKGTSGDASSAETIAGAKKYAKDLVNTLSTELSGADSSILQTLNQIKAELENPDSASGLTSFLDKVTTLINGFDVAGTGSDNNLKNIKTYIDSIKTALEGSISSLSGNAVKQVNGETPDSNGAVTIDGADINVTNYNKSGQTGNVAATDTVNNAIAKVENKADTAVTNAATAEGHAQQALSKLTWIIV